LAAGEARAQHEPASFVEVDRGERVRLRWRTLAVCTALVLGVVALYRPTLHYQFVYDDFQRVVGYPRIQMPPAEWWRFFVPRQGGYRPLRNLSYAIDFQLGGLDPAAFRRTNIALHAAASLAAFGLALRLGAGWLGAATAAALFAVHPVQTESVTYVAGRRDVLCGALFLFGFLAYVSFRQSGRRAWLAAALVASVGALMAKEMAASLPLVCALWEWCRGGLRIGRRRAVALAMLLLVGALTVYFFYGSFMARQARVLPWINGTVDAHFATVGRVWVHYAALLAYPRTLIADYSGKYFLPSGGFLEWPALGATAAILAWVAAAAALRARQPRVAFAMLWIPVTLLPVSQIIPHGELIAEHYLYLPLFGACLLAGLGAERVAASGRAGRVLAVALAAVAVGALTARTIVRNRDWVDSLTFYTVLREQNPYSPRMYLGLGNEYVQLRQPRLAVHQFSLGLRLAPKSPWLFLNRGAARQQINEFERAEQDYKRALELGLSTRTLWSNLGLLYATTGRYPEARRALKRARALGRARDDASILTNMALLVRAEGNPKRALRLLRRAERLAPGSPGIRDEIQYTEQMLAKSPA
jgi:Flp pilus assembly protein TadD